MGLCLLSIEVNPCQKTKVLKDLFRLLSVPVNFHIRYPWQLNLPPISGVSNIVTCLTHVRQPLKCFNSLAVSRTVAPSQDNTHRIRFQEYGSEHLITNGRYCYSLPKGVYLNQFQK